MVKKLQSKVGVDTLVHGECDVCHKSSWIWVETSVCEMCTKLKAIKPGVGYDKCISYVFDGSPEDLE